MSKGEVRGRGSRLVVALSVLMLLGSVALAPTPPAVAVPLQSPPSWSLSTVAGTGSAGSADGAAGSATFRSPRGIALRPGTDQLYIADDHPGTVSSGDRVRILDLSSGTVSTLTSGGDLEIPGTIQVAADGTVYLADSGRVIEIDTSGNQSVLLTDLSGPMLGLEPGDGGLWFARRQPHNPSLPDRDRLVRYDLAGASETDYGEPPHGTTSTCTWAASRYGVSIAFGPAGVPYVTFNGIGCNGLHYYMQRILRVDGPGDFTPLTGAWDYDGVAMSDAGHVFGVSGSTGQIRYHSLWDLDASALYEATYYGGNTCSLSPPSYPANVLAGCESRSFADGFPGRMAWQSSQIATYAGTAYIADAGNLRIRAVDLPPLPEPEIDKSEYFGPNGAACAPCWYADAADPVDTAIGNFHYPLPGLSVAGRGPGLFFGAAYNSQGTDHTGALGAGWSTILDTRLVSEPDGRRTVVQEGGATVPFRPVGSELVAPERFSATLVEESDGTFTFTRQHFQTFRFAETGELIGIADVFGNETTISYDAGQAEFMTDEAGRQLAFVWDGDRLESVTDERDDGAGPRSLGFSYDVSGRLETFTDADGGVWHFAWSGDLLTELRRPEAGATGPAVVNDYVDASGRVEWQEDEEGRRTSFAYNTPAAGTTRVTMPSGLVRDDVYAGGVLVAQTVGVGTAEPLTTSWTRDPATLAHTSMTDPDENTWTYTVDGDGNRLSSTDPTGRVTRWTYNDFDQVTSVQVGETAAPLTPSTAAVVTSTFEFDPDDGRLLEAVTADGTAEEATTSYQYADAAHPEDVTSITDGRNKIWSFDYDPDTGDLLETVDPETNTTTFEYNSIGWLTTQVAPRGNASGAMPADFTTTFAHDGFGRVVSSAGPEGTASSWEFDGNGNLIETVAGLGSAEELVTTFDHDDSGRLLWEDPPGPGRRDYTTWPDGQQKTFTNELSATWSYGLDDLGRLETVTDPLSNTTTYGYDDAGLLGTVTDATGHVTSYLYDEAGRPEVVDYADAGTPDLTAIAYDTLGRRTSATVGVTVETWAWDHASRLKEHVDVNGRTTSYGWDDTNNLTAIGYPGAGTLTRAFDDAGRLESVTDWASRTTTFGYDENGNWDQTTFPAASANVDLYAFDDADRLTSITWRRSTTVQGSLTYAPRDGLGNVTSVTGAGVAGASQGWDYDARARLTTAGGESFGYDAASNITEGPDGVLGVFDPAQRLCWTSPTATGGDCTTPAADATTFGFDDAGRRTSMTLPSGDTATYDYDGAGRLTEAVLPAATEAEDRQYQTVTPAVVADTDAPTGSCDGGTCATLVADDPVEVRVAGVGGIPASGVVAVTGTITVTNPTADGFVELNPTGDAAAGVVAAEAGTTSSGGFTAALDAQGDLVIQASVGADVTIEVSGYFTPPPIWVPARNYWPVTPTSIGSGSLAAGTTNVTVAGVGGVPAAGVSAVTVTVLASASGAGNLRFAPNGAASAGTVSWDAAFPIGSGSYTVPVNSDGTITVAASTATTLGGFSVTGYWAAPTAGDGGLGLELLDGGPARVLDTTTGTGTCVPSPCDTVINAAAPTQVTVAGVAGVPAEAEAVLVSVAATGAGNGVGAVSSSAAGGNVAMLAFDAGIVASTSVIVPVDDDGTIGLAALYTNAEFTIDIVGHFSRPSTTITYEYGADGLRTRAEGTSLGEREYTWSAAGGLPLLLAEHRGTATSYLVYGPGGAPLYQVTAAGQPVYFHLDHLGSVRHTTHANGTARGALTYSAYGEITANTTSWVAEQPLLGYAGEYHEPGTGFIYLRARHYDPATGQFLTRDPLESVTREPYGYAGSNPANATDPTGLFAIPIVAVVVVVVVVVAGTAAVTPRDDPTPREMPDIGGGLRDFFDWLTPFESSDSDPHGIEDLTGHNPDEIAQGIENHVPEDRFGPGVCEEVAEVLQDSSAPVRETNNGIAVRDRRRDRTIIINQDSPWRSTAVNESDRRFSERGPLR